MPDMMWQQIEARLIAGEEVTREEYEVYRAATTLTPKGRHIRKTFGAPSEHEALEKTCPKIFRRLGMDPDMHLPYSYDPQSDHTAKAVGPTYYFCELDIWPDAGRAYLSLRAEKKKTRPRTAKR